MNKGLFSYLFIFLAVASLPLLAQKKFTANEAADSVQNIRHAASKLYNKDHPTRQDIENGIQLLNNAVRFVDSVPIKELSRWNLYLQFRKSDVLRELVYAYGLNHQNDMAVATLNKHFEEGTSTFILDMQTDSDLAGLRTDPGFIAAINKYKARLGLWNGDAFKTPYLVDLPATEKLAGLSLLWSQARAVFVYFDKLQADWNQTYMDFIPQVLATKSTLEYYRVLQKFYAQLHDGHTNVYLPKEITREVNSRPPVKTELIEGRVFITAVPNDSLRNAGIVPGLEILKIDNIPVKEYADTYVKPYQSSSTPQDMDQREYTYALLSGAAGKPIALNLRDRKGKIITVSLPRSGYPPTKPAPAMAYTEIDHVGYLTISNFEDNKIAKQFDSLFTQISATKGLIIDIRNNGGGDSNIGNQILARLTGKSFDLFAFKHIRFDAMYTEPIWANDGVAGQRNDRKTFYSKPVALLVNGATFSAAEDFTVAFDYMKRGQIIGQPTGGSTGQPIGFKLPGGGSARVCGRRETYPDGKEFVDVGIKPAIIISKSINDLYNGTDAVLAKALELLK